MIASLFEFHKPFGSNATKQHVKFHNDHTPLKHILQLQKLPPMSCYSLNRGFKYIYRSIFHSLWAQNWKFANKKFALKRKTFLITSGLWAPKPFMRWIPGGSQYKVKMTCYQYRDPHVVTVLSLTWESPYLGKIVIILRWDPGLPWRHYDPHNNIPDIKYG